MAAGAPDVALLSLRSPHCTAAAAWAACGLLMALAFEPANCEALLRGDASAECIKAVRRYPKNRNIGWAVAGLLLKLVQACKGSAAAAADCFAASYLLLLEEGVGAALAMHAATDARVARAAVAAVSGIAAARAACGETGPAALMDSVRATLAACEARAAAVRAVESGGDSIARHHDDVEVSLCRRLLSP